MPIPMTTIQYITEEYPSFNALPALHLYMDSNQSYHTPQNVCQDFLPAATRAPAPSVSRKRFTFPERRIMTPLSITKTPVRK